VVIDPGHGKGDPGITGHAGWSESRLAMTFARRLAGALEEKGLTAILTRDERQNPSLPDRVALANGMKADVLLSLHAGMAPLTNKAGFTVFYQGYPNQPGPDELETMDADICPDVSKPGNWSGIQSRHLVESRRLAHELDQALQDVLRIKSPGPVALPLAVLAGADQPAVLIEIGALGNEEIEQRLSDPAYRDALVRAMIAGLDSWRLGRRHRNQW
jgi:N-acetylmuramoyl-L-alanine amidase